MQVDQEQSHLVITDYKDGSVPNSKWTKKIQIWR